MSEPATEPRHTFIDLRCPGKSGPRKLPCKRLLGTVTAPFSIKCPRCGSLVSAKDDGAVEVNNGTC